MGAGSLGSPPLNLLRKEVRALAAWRRGGRFGPAMRTSHDGKGHHVLVLPGFLASDGSTVMLRRTLDAAHYRSHGWAMGRNLGIRRDIFHRLDRRMDYIQRHDPQPVSLIGWSLGRSEEHTSELQSLMRISYAVF